MLLHHFVHYIENELKGETLKAEKQCSEASVWLFTYVPSIGKSCLFYFYLFLHTHHIYTQPVECTYAQRAL